MTSVIGHCNIHEISILVRKVRGIVTSNLEEKQKPEKTTTKIDRELLRKARTIASYRDVDLADYLDDVLRNKIEVDFKLITGE